MLRTANSYMNCGMNCGVNSSIDCGLDSSSSRCAGVVATFCLPSQVLPPCLLSLQLYSSPPKYQLLFDAPSSELVLDLVLSVSPSPDPTI